MIDEDDSDDDIFPSLEDIFTEEKKSKRSNSGRLTKKQIQIDELNAMNWWQRAMSDPVGRLEIWKIINNKCGAFSTIFGVSPAGQPQTEASWFHAGEKSVGLKLYHEIMSNCPKEILLMHYENDPRFVGKDIKF